MLERLAAILFADVVGSTVLLARDEAMHLVLFDKYKSQYIEPMAVGAGGKVNNIAGDGVFVEFANPRNAVQYAIDLQSELESHNSSIAPADRIIFRVGIHFGHIIGEGVDARSLHVNIAHLVQERALPGGISVSEHLLRQIQGGIGLDVRSFGELRLEEIENPILLYSISPCKEPFYKNLELIYSEHTCENMEMQGLTEIVVRKFLSEEFVAHPAFAQIDLRDQVFLTPTKLLIWINKRGTQVTVEKILPATLDYDRMNAWIGLLAKYRHAKRFKHRKEGQSPTLVVSVFSDTIDHYEIMTYEVASYIQNFEKIDVLPVSDVNDKRQKQESNEIEKHDRRYDFAKRTDSLNPETDRCGYIKFLLDQLNQRIRNAKEVKLGFDRNMIVEKDAMSEFTAELELALSCVHSLIVLIAPTE